ncbi:hypothetical protein CERZMDRAFT_96939 [Cercospora zeae-maydis SCOH1-5]|uniref:Uncharacterized protein n=1 Tax=Cercospora zeae-maydis SCOH1-5 TaxID=717836 RepID=A0A6A6FJ74_9PEZI|nr:hypothetical protein CERZMDRAFT_96939 [Cercospora zeae-maydis SCOH1-5]
MAQRQTLHDTYLQRYNLKKIRHGTLLELIDYRDEIEGGLEPNPEAIWAFVGVGPGEWPTNDNPAVCVETLRDDCLSILDRFVRDAEDMVSVKQADVFEDDARVELIPTCYMIDDDPGGNGTFYYDLMATGHGGKRTIGAFFENLQPGTFKGKRSFWLWLSVMKNSDWFMLRFKTEYQLANEAVRAQVGDWTVSSLMPRSALGWIISRDIKLLKHHIEPLLQKKGLVIQELKPWLEVDAKTGHTIRQYTRLGQTDRFLALLDLFRKGDMEGTSRPTLRIVFEIEVSGGPEKPSIPVIEYDYRRTGTVAFDQFIPQRKALYKPISIDLHKPHSAPICDPGKGHMPMIYMCVKRSPDDVCMLVPAREINGTWTGSYTQGQPAPLTSSPITPIELRTADDKPIEENVLEVLDEEETPPIVPNLTFLPWKPPSFFPEQSNYPVHLAVRLVNLLPTSWNTQHLQLPPDITLTVKGTWRWALWILPQKHAGVMRVKEHDLHIYLDEKQVKRGNRKMFLEAHLLPRKEDKSGYKPYGIVGKSLSANL